jgi:ribose transport system substrate-binding protein
MEICMKLSYGVPKLAICLLAAVLMGCGQPPVAAPPAGGGAAAPPVPPAKGKGVIGVSLLALSNPFFKVMADAMTAEGKKAGYEVLITSAEYDSARQKDQVKDFIVKQVSAIVLCPCDARSIGTSIMEANQAGIPVFTADTGCLDPNAKVVTHVATDNYLGGKQAGQAMIDALHGKGKVAIIDHPEVESVILRTKGFREVLDKVNGMPIVADLPGGADRAPAYKTAQDILEKNPDLAGIFCINDPTAFGAVAAVEKARKQDKIKIVSFDGMAEAKKAIKDGKIYAEPIQYPDRIGTMTVQSIEKYLAGEKPEPKILIPSELYTKEMADKDPAVK